MAQMNNTQDISQACAKAAFKLFNDRVFRDSVKDYVILSDSPNINNSGFYMNFLVPHDDIGYITISYVSNLVGNRVGQVNETEHPIIIQCMIFNTSWQRIYRDEIGYRTTVYVSTTDELIAEIKRIASWRSIW